MSDPQSNGFYRTTDFREAIYLRRAGAIYDHIDWPTPQQAYFVFKRPSDEILAAWGKGDDVGVRATLDAADFFRDELRRRP